jgi:hypothetical protein
LRWVNLYLKKFLRKNLICANKGRVSDPDPH